MSSRANQQGATGESRLGLVELADVDGMKGESHGLETVGGSGGGLGDHELVADLEDVGAGRLVGVSFHELETLKALRVDV